MMKFLHISDIHMTVPDSDSQFDQDIRIRRALIDDLKRLGRGPFDGIFITGDIAYHGQPDEYKHAKLWIEELRVVTESSPESIFVVPGNHDVNRGTVSRDSSLWDLHQAIRSISDTQLQLESLKKKLKDPFDFLAALSDYRTFASEYGCPTSSKELAWVHVFDEGKSLTDGTLVRLHGLNSAILSDGADLKANLLVGDFQFSHFDGNSDYVNIVLCHHPQSWLIDGNEANDYYRAHAQVVLCGHEHSSRCYKEAEVVRVFAGAVHPNRREKVWEPCYNLLSLDIDLSSGQRELVVNVETRVWQEKNKSFIRLPHSDQRDDLQERIRLPPAKFAALKVDNGSAPVNMSPPRGPEMNGNALTEEAFQAARRKLIVHFFRLGILHRYEVAIQVGIWSDEDDALDGQARWARVFDRAEKSNKLEAFWDAVAKNDPTLSGQSNPFVKKY